MECLVKRIIESEASGVRMRDRPLMGWMKRTLEVRGVSLEQGTISM